MCGRYWLMEDWLRYCEFERLRMEREYVQPDLFTGTREVFPRTFQPIIRLNEAGVGIVERRRWGFHRTWPDPKKPDHWVKREHINAVGATVGKLKTFKASFQTQRCLIPLTAWWEWPELQGVKTRVDISMKNVPVIMAAGLFELSKDNKTGEDVQTFTMVTTEPNEFLGTVHDRAPLIIEPDDWDDWLQDVKTAETLIHAHPDSSKFEAVPVDMKTGRKIEPTS